MLAIPVTPCPSTAVDKLAALQAEVNQQLTFEEKKATAERLWSNRTDNKAFDAVRAGLQALCPGGYCCYCETNEPSPVEHIWPKSHYPEQAFLWTNYLFACYNCNSIHKRDRWAIFQDSSGSQYDEDGTWSGPPPSGDPAFLDLRADNPQLLIRLDFETFFYEPCTTNPRERARVEYTVNQVLKLNERGFPEARAFAYSGYRDRLTQLAQIPPSHRNTKAPLFQGVPQRTVWKEMQRWHQRYSELDRLFKAAPEALNW